MDPDCTNLPPLDADPERHGERVAERLDLALRGSRLSLWDVDLETGQVYLNEQWSSLLGKSGGESVVPMAELRALVHPEDAHRVLAAFVAAVKGETADYLVEHRVRVATGGYKWIASHGMVTRRDERGRALRMTGTNADIDERKHNEARLAAALLEQRALLAASPAGVYIVGDNRCVLQANEAMERMCGYHREEMVGLPTRDLCVDEADWRWIGAEGYEQIDRHGLLRLELRLRRRDGSEFWGLVQGVAIDPRDPGRGRLFTAVDISAQKGLEDNLREADRRKDTFIATLAHELRNPLAPIRNAVAILRQGGTSEQKQAWCRDVIERQVAQMAHLLEDLLDVSRITSGKLTLRRERLDLAAVIDQAVEIARPLIDDGGHTLSVELPPEPVELDGDRTRLAQVFSNLLTNAAKYSERGGSIRLRAEVRNHELVVSVRDSGIGIAAEHLPRIFEMFSQVDLAMNRSQGGLGLGLSLVKGLVEMHAGHITATSEGPGRGSEFTVWLPLPERRPVAPPNAENSAQPGGVARGRVLVVDDNHDVALTLGLLCELDGHEVKMAYDGEQAVALAQTFRPNVILLDLGMPKLNGLDACRRIRAEAWSEGMVLVALTGWGQEEDKRKTEEAGFHHHLVKPVEPAALSSLLAGIKGSGSRAGG